MFMKTIKNTAKVQIIKGNKKFSYKKPAKIVWKCTYSEERIENNKDLSDNNKKRRPRKY